MLPDDVDAADSVLRLAFGTVRGLSDPATAFGDRDLVRTRFRAAPECAWVAEADGEVVGSAFAARWGSFAFFGPLTVHPGLWDRGIGSRLLQPVLDAFTRWEVRQAGLFTFAASPKHLALYQKHGFWPGPLTVLTAKEVDPLSRHAYDVASRELDGGSEHVLEEIRRLTDRVFPGLDVTGEVVTAQEQKIGDTVLVRRDGSVEGVAVCHTGPGSEAGGDTCYVKFAAVSPGRDATARFGRLLDACEAFSATAGLGRLEAGVNAGRLDAYRSLLDRRFRIEQIGVSMRLRPEDEHFDSASDFVISDLR